VVTLRPYRPSDFTRLVEIDQACFGEGIAYDEEQMSYFLVLPSSTALVVEEKGSIRGFIIADRFRPRRAKHDMGRIITIDVVKESQGSGVGTLLLKSAEAELKQAGCDYISLEVAVDNERALRFYKAHGYSVLKTLPRYYQGSMDGLLMGKSL
jgi:ribosomal-protein-alanine N-acetyltransferase